MKLISIDPSSKGSSYALFENHQLVEYGKLPLEIPALNEFFSKLGEHILAIEDQYVSFNVHSFQKLVEERTKIETISALNNGIYCYRIHANKWQSSMLKVNKKIKRKERKQLAKEVASLFAPMEITNEDIADAILIGEYTLKEILKGGSYEKSKD